MTDPAAVLVAARGEEATIAATVAALQEQFPTAEVIVADDGSRDATADELRRVLTFASSCAALTCSRAGANPPRRDEVGATVDIGG